MRAEHFFHFVNLRIYKFVNLGFRGIKHLVDPCGQLRGHLDEISVLQILLSHLSKIFVKIFHRVLFLNRRKFLVFLRAVISEFLVGVAL